MALNVKVGLIGKLDMLKFKNMSKVREKAIEAAPAKEVSGDFKININAKSLHPDFEELVISDIISHNNSYAKTYVLKRSDGKALPYFRAGQYLSLKYKIDGSETTRAYSICSSPKDALNGSVSITICPNPNGFTADKLLETLKVGDKVIASDPQGFFYYEDLRDCHNVIGIAGGSGITPFLSMAYAIKDGIEDFNLTILYGSRKVDSILFKEELDKLVKQCPKLKVVYVISDEKVDGYENGFISAELIKKYAPSEEYSIFMCGPKAMYKFVEPEVKKLNIPNRLFRKELNSVTSTPWKEDGYPSESKDKEYSISVKQGDKEYKIKASANETVLVALERAGIKAPSRCRSGECGWCRSKLVSGTIFTPKENEFRRWADEKYGYIHPCCSFPTSDLVIEVSGEYY